MKNQSRKPNLFLIGLCVLTSLMAIALPILLLIGPKFKGFSWAVTWTLVGIVYGVIIGDMAHFDRLIQSIPLSAAF